MAAAPVKIPAPLEFAFSTTAPMAAVIFTNPFDVAKVRVQLQGEGGKGAVKVYKGPMDCMIKMFRQEGAMALQKGLSTAMLREGSKNLFRIGMYNPVIDVLHDKKNGTPPLWKRMVAGTVSGIMGAMSCNPFEVIKTRMQSQGKTAIGAQHGYSGVFNAFGTIYKKEGLKGLYKGVDASMIRSGIASGINLPTYSYAKDYIPHVTGLKDGALVDMSAALVSAAVTVATSNPVDVIRTRLYNQPFGPDGKGLIYTNFFDGFRKVMKSEGPVAFYKGSFPSFMRLGPHFALTFVFLEQMNRVARGFYKEKATSERNHRYFSDFQLGPAGEIEQAEVVRVFVEANPYNPRLHGPSAQAHTDHVTADVKTLFEKADIDKNGRLSYKEFETISAELHKTMRERNVRHMFNEIDTDKSGEITAQELRVALTKHLPARTGASPQEVSAHVDAQVAAIMAKADVDHSGSINFDEFRAIFATVDDFHEELIFKEWARQAGVGHD